MKQPDEKQSQLVKIETPAGIVTLSPAIVRKYLVNGNGIVTEQEVQFFLALCKYQQLNPFLREAYLIKYGSQPATIVTGKEAFLKRAQKIPECRGYRAGVICQCQESKEIVTTEGYCPPSCDLVAGWAEVQRSNWDIPLRVEVSLAEYIGKKSDGSPSRMWSEKPATMIRKVALVQALREAFPESFGGMYSPEEINTIQDELPTTHVVVPPPVEEPASKLYAICPEGGPKANQEVKRNDCDTCAKFDGCPSWE
jgi:phage recombination protein Bet